MVDLDKYKVIILGSCVTRDVFRIDRIGVEVVDYFARTSIKSLISPPLIVDNNEISLESEFQKRMVVRDFSKDFWRVLIDQKFDLLLIDFIDERFNLFNYKDSIITKSNELIQSGFISRHQNEVREVLRRSIGASECRSDLIQFSKRMSQAVPPEKIVLIKAFWAEKFVNQSGELMFFDKRTKFSLEQIRMANESLRTYYDDFVEFNPKCQIVEGIEPFADWKHVWGLSPFHYQDDWYHDCRKKIDEIAKSIGVFYSSGVDPQINPISR